MSDSEGRSPSVLSQVRPSWIEFQLLYETGDHQQPVPSILVAAVLRIVTDGSKIALVAVADVPDPVVDPVPTDPVAFLLEVEVV